MGREFAFELATYSPERIRTLALLSAHPYGAGPGGGEFYADWSQSFRAGGMEWWQGYTLEAFAEFPDWCLQPWESEDPASLADQAAAFGSARDISATVGLAQLPLLQIAGGREAALERYRETAALGCPGQFVVLPELDHLGVFLRSDLVVPHLRAFLASRD